MFEEPRLIFVALEGLANVLEAGKRIAQDQNSNPYSLMCEQFGVVEQLESL
jgi:hypothetical protein